MMLSSSILIKGFVAAVIVGFVTSSIRSWVDRVFLVIILVGLVGLPIGNAIVVNLTVVALAALLLAFRQRAVFRSAVSAENPLWVLIIAPAVVGGIVGRLAASAVTPVILLTLLGVYAILVGLRIFFIKPLPERGQKAHFAWAAPVSLGSGLLMGIMSTGAKPFAVPAYNNAMGHHPRTAYAFATLGVVSAAWSALATQFIAVAVPTSADLLLALYEFVLITVTALIVNRFWSERLNRIVNLTIAPVLIIVGIRFIIMTL